MIRTLSEKVRLFENSDIYPVISSEFCSNRPVCDILLSIAKGGAKIVQIREKNMSDCEMFSLLTECKKITDSFNMLLIVDDRVDLAVAVQADGVHLGQDDFPLPAAKSIAPEMLFGISTHNEEEIDRALKENCSYLNIGPMFPTGTKAVPCGALGLDTINTLRKKVTCPYSVMGGIKEHHLKMLIEQGFRHIAMVTEITQAPDAEQKVKDLRSYWR